MSLVTSAAVDSRAPNEAKKLSLAGSEAAVLHNPARYSSSATSRCFPCWANIWSAIMAGTAMSTEGSATRYRSQPNEDRPQARLRFPHLRALRCSNSAGLSSSRRSMRPIPCCVHGVGARCASSPLLTTRGHREDPLPPEAVAVPQSCPA